MTQEQIQKNIDRCYKLTPDEKRSLLFQLIGWHQEDVERGKESAHRFFEGLEQLLNGFTKKI